MITDFWNTGTTESVAAATEAGFNQKNRKQLAAMVVQAKQKEEELVLMKALIIKDVY